MIQKTVSGIKQLPRFYNTVKGYKRPSSFMIPAVKNVRLLDDVMKHDFETIVVEPSDIFRSFDIGNVSYTPQQRFDVFKDLDLKLKRVQLPELEKIISDFYEKRDLIQSDPVLNEIATTSPQYMDELYEYAKSGKETMQDFVRDLIQKSNTYRRTMTSYGKPLTDSDFLTFGKRGTIDVEAAPSNNYGNTQRIYIGHPTLKGDVTTWWDQRIPEGIRSTWSESEPSSDAPIVTPGMHAVPRSDLLSLERLAYTTLDSNYKTGLGTSPKSSFIFDKLNTTEIPRQYLWEPAHQVFKGTPGSTLPGFEVFEQTPDWLKSGEHRIDFGKFSKGYKQGGIIKAQRGLGKIITKALKPVVKNSSKGLNLESWPKASYKYNSKTGDFDVVVPLKDWVKEGEYLTYDYFNSPFEYNRLLESGTSPDLANEIMAVRSVNTINRLPNAFRNLGKNTYGTAENKDGRPLIRYNARRGVKSSLVTPEITLNTVFHELGGHGSSLNIGSGVQVIPEGQIEILPKIYKHNAELKPVLRPVFQAIKDGDLETANSLASSLDDMYKDESGKLNIKKIKELIEYMEDVQEYSARAIASNMSDYYGLKPGWNEEQLRKYFTDESVDNLKKMVWGIGVPLTASIISSNELKKGGIIKAQGGWGKVVRKMPNLLLEAIGTGKKAASEFFKHPVVKQSYEHNKDIAKRLGITLQDRPENIAEIVDSPIGVNFVPYNNNGEIGAIHHSGIDDPNQLLSIAWTPMTESQAERIGFHEMLHRGFYSAPIKYVNTDFDYYNNVYQPTYKYWHWKTSKLLKPGTMDSYLGDVHSGEAGTNLAEVGKIAGVKMGEKWSGDEKFLETLDKWPEDKKFMLDYLNTDTRAGRRHIWDAMAAKYFTIGTAAAFSNWLNNSNDKETKKPAL